MKCIYCQGQISAWKVHDKPIIKHKKYFPTCPFIINLDVANQPAEKEKLKESQIDKELENYHGEIAYNVIRPKEQRSYLHEEIEEENYRENTFTNKWKNLRDLAFQGLYVQTRKKQPFISCYKCKKEY